MQSPRFKPKEHITGYLTRVRDGLQIPFKVVNFSGTGLGLEISIPIQSGDDVKITISNPYTIMLEGQIVWSRQSKDSELFFCGIEVMDSLRRLESLCHQYDEAV